jgi:hypothetical protein
LSSEIGHSPHCATVRFVLCKLRKSVAAICCDLKLDCDPASKGTLHSINWLEIFLISTMAVDRRTDLLRKKTWLLTVSTVVGTSSLRLHDPSRSAYTKYMELFFSEFFYKINFEAMLDFWLVSRHLNGGR